MSNKNAYEIRLEILKLAHSDESTRFYEQLNCFRTQDETGNINNPSEEVINNLFPKTSDIISRANELYKFVEGVK